MQAKAKPTVAIASQPDANIWRAIIHRPCEEWVRDGIEVSQTTYRACGAVFARDTHAFVRLLRQDEYRDFEERNAIKIHVPVQLEGNKIRFFTDAEGHIGASAQPGWTLREMPLPPETYCSRELELLATHEDSGVVMGHPYCRQEAFDRAPFLWVLPRNATAWTKIEGARDATWLSQDQLLAISSYYGYAVFARSSSAAQPIVETRRTDIDIARPVGYRSAVWNGGVWRLPNGAEVAPGENDVALFVGQRNNVLHVQHSDREEFASFTSLGNWGRAVAERYVRNAAERRAAVFMDGNARTMQGHWYVGGCERTHFYIQIREMADRVEHRVFTTANEREATRIARDWFTATPSSATIVLDEDGQYRGDPSTGRL